MKKEQRTEIIKVRLSDCEKQQLEDMAQKENMDKSKLIRNKIFAPEKGKSKKGQNQSVLDQEKLNQQKLTMGKIYSCVNQLKANVDPENAILQLESEVQTLWRLLK